MKNPPKKHKKGNVFPSILTVRWMLVLYDAILFTVATIFFLWFQHTYRVTNDAFTWEVVKDKADAVLSDIQARRGITDYRVICDETVNAILEGMFALIIPVTTSTEGLCVAIIKCIPAALAI